VVERESRFSITDGLPDEKTSSAPLGLVSEFKVRVFPVGMALTGLLNRAIPDI